MTALLYRGNRYGASFLPVWPHISLGFSVHVGSRFSHLTLHMPFGILTLGCIGLEANDLAARMTTHDGFYSPCDEDCCIETRKAIRRAWGRA